jgi:hypothetical protein
MIHFLLMAVEHPAYSATNKIARAKALITLKIEGVKISYQTARESKASSGFSSRPATSTSI